MKTKLYIAEWPDGTISILTAKNTKELFCNLDSESDPYDTKITEIKFEDGIYIKTDSKSKIDWSVNYETTGAEEKIIHDKKKRLFKGLGEMYGLDFEPSQKTYNELGLTQP